MFDPHGTLTSDTAAHTWAGVADCNVMIVTAGCETTAPPTLAGSVETVGVTCCAPTTDEPVAAHTRAGVTACYVGSAVGCEETAVHVQTL